MPLERPNFMSGRRTRLGRSRPRFAFTLLELLVVIAIMAMLAGLMLPTMAQVRITARSAACRSDVRQMVLALHMYTHENNGWIFPQRQDFPGEGRLWWFGFEANGGPAAEGQRNLDRTRGRLWPYYQHTDSIEVCPSFPVQSPHYKPKFNRNWTTYGYPQQLMNPVAPTNTTQIRDTSQTLAFADSAQINVFQPPATPSNPMFEQWYYIARFEQTVAYLHDRQANAAMFDGHVRTIEPQFGLNEIFPEAPVGRPPNDVVIQVK